MDPTSQNEEILNLQNEYESIDTQKRGYITSEQLVNYFKTKPSKPAAITINMLYNALPNGQLTQQRFVTFMLGFKLALEKFAVARFGLQKSLGQFVDASPAGGGVNEIKNSFVKFKALAKESQSGNIADKKHLQLRVGCDKVGQDQKYTLMNSLLGRDCSDIFLLIKFAMDSKGQEMANTLSETLNNLKGLAGEMAPDLFELIQSINITCKADGKFVYVIIEIEELFFLDCAKFFNELTCILNPEAQIIFSFLVESAFLKKILHQGSDQKVDDLLIKFGLDIDSQSLSKSKQIYLNKISTNEIKSFSSQEKTFQIFLSLLNEVQFEANFAESQKLINEAGIGSGMDMMKERLGILKDLQIEQTAQGFVPGFGSFFKLLKENGKGQGEISMNAKSCFVGVEFNMQIDGLFDLI